MIGAQIVVTGGPDDTAVADEVAAGTDGHSVAGRLSLTGLAALYRRSALVVANDSGPAHIAYAVDSPSVTVFGAASPAEWAPLDRSRHAVVEAAEPCRPCVDRLCIQTIPVEAVVGAAEGLVARGIVRVDQPVARPTPASSVALEMRPGPTSDA
jgi:ADP-heptose:LPS heptosyltransferase